MAFPRENSNTTYTPNVIGAETNKRLREIKDQLCCISQDPLGVACDKPMYVKSCDNNYLTNQILCTPDSVTKVFVIISLDANGIPTVTYYNMSTGGIFSGTTSTLINCPTNTTISEAVEMCDNGTTFLRWFITTNGQPTGTVFNTTLAGASYTVVATPTLGVCGTKFTDEEAICYTTNGSTLSSGWKRFIKDAFGAITSVVYLDSGNNVITGVTEKPCMPTGVDYEKACYSTDGGLTIKTGWRQLKHSFDAAGNINLTTVLLDSQLGSITGTPVEYLCEQSIVPMCAVEQYTLTNYGDSGSVLGFVYTPSYGTPTLTNGGISSPGNDLIISDIFIFYDENIVSTVPVIDFEQLGAGSYSIKRIITTQAGFEFIYTTTFIYDGGGTITGTTSICSNTNISPSITSSYGINYLNTYTISKANVLVHYNVDGQVSVITDLIGNPFTLFTPYVGINVLPCPGPFTSRCSQTINADKTFETTTNRISTSAAGSTAAGLYSVDFYGVSGTGMTVSGVPIAAGEKVTYTSYYNPTKKQFMKLPAMSYSGVGGVLRINTIA